MPYAADVHKQALEQARERLPALVTHRSNLSTPEGREDLFAWVSREHADTNVLVNNAGIQNWMSASDADFFDRTRAELAINVEAPLHLAQLFLQHTALDTIVNVTSGLAFTPMVKAPVYSATKAPLHSFTLSLRQSCKPKVEVVELIPPALNTDLGGKGLHDFAPPVADFIEAVFEQLARGETTVTFGGTERLEAAGRDVLAPMFARINRLG